MGVSKKEIRSRRVAAERGLDSIPHLAMFAFSVIWTQSRDDFAHDVIKFTKRLIETKWMERDARAQTDMLTLNQVKTLWVHALFCQGGSTSESKPVQGEDAPFAAACAQQLDAIRSTLMGAR